MTKARRKLVVTKTMQRIIDRCRSGEALCRRHIQAQAATYEDDWFFEPSGRRAPPKAAQRCIRDGLLVSNADGLLSDDPQSWRAA